MKKARIKHLDLRYFIIPFGMLLFLFSLFMYRDVQSWVRDTNEDLREDAMAITDRYTSSLLNAEEAQRIIEQLLDEKLKVASEAVLRMEDRKDSAVLTELGVRFQLDEIHLYNPEGEIIYSKGNKYVGWKVYAGHPVDRFMKSGLKYLVEDIRKDSESDNFYKYAYIRDDDGSFIQIGLHTDQVKYFLDRFKVQNMIDQLASYTYIDNLCFVGEDGTIVASSRKEEIGQVVADEKVMDTLLNGKVQEGRMRIGEEEVFRVSAPVEKDEQILGVLSVDWDMKESRQEILSILWNGAVKFLVMAVVLFFIMYYGYRKNKHNIQLAYYDSLTGLPNQTYLQEYLSELLDSSKQERLALLLLNCNNFKVLNMTYGFRYGNEVLMEIAQKLQGIIGKKAKLFRFDGDRFAVVAWDYKNREALREKAQNLLEIFREPIFSKDGHQYLSMEISIVEKKELSDTVDKLVQDAALALANINKNEAYSIAFYEDIMENQVMRQDKIEKTLRGCIMNPEEDEFSLVFQPKWNLKKNKVEGFEALARLSAEELGAVSPLEFISIAEKRHLIYDLGNLIFWKTGQFMKMLKAEGYIDAVVSVNVSGIQLLRESFVADFDSVLRTFDVEPGQLEIEITESVILENFALVNEKLQEIKERGALISLDDFGTGFSSLARLREMNIDIVKIDKYFIDKISMNPEHELITADIISMAHKLGLKTVAEGVETSAQMEYLKNHNCDFVQGYYVSKPLSSEHALEFLKKQGGNEND